MKSKRLMIPSLLFLALFSILMTSYGVKGYEENETVEVWLTLSLKEYRTDIPVSNVSMSVTIYIRWEDEWGDIREEIMEGSHVTDERGRFHIYLGNITPSNSIIPPRLIGISLSDNYTLIKVNDVFLEDTDFSAQCVLSNVEYSDMWIRVDQEFSDSQVTIKADCWVLKGKTIVISDSDPITGEKSVISLKPAVKIASKNETAGEYYEGLYLAPLNYEILISYAPKGLVEYRYPPLRVPVNGNTSFINWMYYAAKSYINKKIASIGKEIKRLNSTGLPLNREVQEHGALKNLAIKILSLYSERKYSAALSGMKLFASRAIDLERWLGYLKLFAVIATACVSLFAYGVASLISNFIFEEPAKNKERLIIKIFLFALLIVLFSLTNPSSKITCIIIVENAIGSPVPVADAFTSLLGTFVIGALTYFLITLASIKRSSVSDIALQMSIRGLKRRPFRTILTLITITIVVSSSILFTNITFTRETRIKGSWPGTQISCLILRSDVTTELDIYDVTWIKKQEFCSNISYIEAIKRYERSGRNTLIHTSVIYLNGKPRITTVIGIDPSFMEKYYNFSTYVRGSWKEFASGDKVVLLPTNYDVTIGDYVMLGIDEKLSAPMMVIHLGVRNLGRFKVVGKFDPAQLSSLRKMDNSPFFNNEENTVLVPVGVIKDPTITISEVTVIMAPGFDPVDVAENIAYSLGVPVIANKDRVAVLVVWSLEISAVGFIQYLIPLIIASLMMYVTMASIYEERKRELFTLAVLGLDPRNTFFTFIGETLLFGLLGTFIGFFGSYIIAVLISFISNLFGITILISYANWSIFTVFAAFFTGIVMVFLGGYIPAVRAQGLSLMGRVKTRELLGELISEEDNFVFILPIRESAQNGELLYEYTKETLRKMPPSLVDHHSIKGQLRRDGSFNVSFVATGSGQSVLIPCTLRSERNRDTLTLSIAFPKIYGNYEQIRRILRDLEAAMIGFSAWRDMQLKMKIVRETPKKQKTMDEILEEVKHVIEQIKGFNKKLRFLESQKGKLTEEIYNEFKQKYLKMLEEKFKILRSMTIGLEPYLSQIREEIKKTSLEIERISIAYNLGEINEEEYIKVCSPMQNKLNMLKSKLKELEEIFEFLKKPVEMI